MASEEGKQLKHRSVVSSFIFKFENHRPAVALFRRSDKVNTYQHRLAPISGSVEKTDASPLAAAWREIREETTLTPASLSLWRQGKSYSFADESIGRSWTIYPFAFKLKTASEGGRGEQGIQIDWEHEGWSWHDPHEVEDTDDFGGVPRLAESLRRVWFEKDLGDVTGRMLADGLETLKNDHQSGARQLAGVALQVLRDVVSNLDSRGPTDEWWVKVRFAAWHIWKNGRESMGAAILSVLLAALGSMENTVKEQSASQESWSQSVKWRDAVVEDLEHRISLRNTESARLVTEALAKYLESTYASKLDSQEPLVILTMSESSTISHSIRHLALESGFALDLRVLESRPLFEGVSMAGAFADDMLSARDSSGQQKREAASTPLQRLKISVYSDASAALAARGADVVIIGADRIAANGAVSNKTGSLPTILSARHVASLTGRPIRVVVLGESEKVAPPGSPDEHVVEDNDPVQIIRAWSAEYNSPRVRHGASRLAEMSTDTSHPAAAVIDVAVHNVFFEWVGPELIDLYMTESGQWTVQDIFKHSSRLAVEEERLFGDL